MAFESFAAARRNPQILKRIGESLFADACRAEADGVATWARWAPNFTPRGDLAMDVDVALAIAAGFVATP